MYSMFRIFVSIFMIHLWLFSLQGSRVWMLSQILLSRGIHIILSIEVRSSYEENLLTWSKCSGALMNGIAHGRRRRAFVLRIRNYSFQVLFCFSILFLFIFPFRSFRGRKDLSGGECNNPRFLNINLNFTSFHFEIILNLFHFKHFILNINFDYYVNYNFKPV